MRCLTCHVLCAVDSAQCAWIGVQYRVCLAWCAVYTVCLAWRTVCYSVLGLVCSVHCLAWCTVFFSVLGLVYSVLSVLGLVWQSGPAWAEAIHSVCPQPMLLIHLCTQYIININDDDEDSDWWWGDDIWESLKPMAHLRKARNSLIIFENPLQCMQWGSQWKKCPNWLLSLYIALIILHHCITDDDWLKASKLLSSSSWSSGSCIIILTIKAKELKHCNLDKYICQWNQLRFFQFG